MPTYQSPRVTPKLNASERLDGHSAGQRPGAGAATNHIAAIHTLKSKLRMTDGDYRSLLLHLTGKDSSKTMSLGERQRVREHMQQLARRMGVDRADQGPQYARAARPLERKVWALWGALGRAGKLDNPNPAALQAWVKRQTGVDHLSWCKPHQLHALIESLKLWQGR